MKKHSGFERGKEALKKALHFVLSLHYGYQPSVIIFGQIKIFGESQHTWWFLLYHPTAPSSGQKVPQKAGNVLTLKLKVTKISAVICVGRNLVT